LSGGTEGAEKLSSTKDIHILLPEPMQPHAQAEIERLFTAHRLWEADDRDAFIARIAGDVRGLARGYHMPITRALIGRLPKLEIIAGFGVGYDGIDLVTSAERGIIVTNTPDVLTEETADTALGLLLMTVRELSAAERHLRAGKWAGAGPYPLTRATMRDRTVGIVGLGRIGMAIARRLDAMKVPVAYHTRTKRDVPYRHYPGIVELARAVDILLIVVPGNEETRHMVDAEVLKALGPKGILINVGRGIVVDEKALIDALRDGTIMSAGLDVFAEEPRVPEELIALPNAVLLPHVGSASVHTRNAMGQLVVDNLTSWFTEGRPVTPVAETPWPRS
jgi:lactate dehydrogenase-like 2-hydroxyacid dehydrogenase